MVNNLRDPAHYINRELSWLQFNTRVLKQAQEESLPLFERLKFLAIYGTNLDEFYMIRIAGLKKLFSAGVNVSGADRLTPLHQLREIRQYLHNEQQSVEHCLQGIMAKLEKEGIFFKSYKEVTQAQRQILNRYFYDNIYPVIVPIAVDTTHPFPHLNNLSFGLILKLRDKDDDTVERYGIVRIPRVLPRFVDISNRIYVPIGSVVAEHIHDLFPGYELIKFSAFRITRNADIAIEEEEADDFMEMLEEGLKLRQKGEIVRLELSNHADDDLLNFFNRHANVFKDDIYRFQTYLNLGALWQVVGNKDFAHLTSPSFKPRNLPPLNSEDSLYTILDKQDLLLYHPFESFEPVVRLIQTAAKDPDVVSIRMTLYRAGSKSVIVQSLIAAAESGKQVTVMVELKARFDEENNLIWAKALENAGAHVIYGITGFKVHAKAALITRRVDGKLKQYAHLGTGNYNPSTATVYTDISYMTSNDAITHDMTRFFHFLTGFSKKGKLNELYMAPTQIKPKVLSLIQNETRMGAEGVIIAKMNSLVDEDIIKALYKASIAGVKIQLIIRGICCLRPGVPGISENIRVTSIIGKYLEHARIFYFKHSKPQTYISSADWMPRNLVRRIELLTPIEGEEISAKLLQILQLQVSDNVLAYELQNDGSYAQVTHETSSVINSHQIVETHTTKVYNSTKKQAPNYAQQLTARLFKES
ncbi:MAG: polyphosphate kinase [Campylobacterota bacterium]|nr:polyphosphate kinase [Campylobacterota bacterium]